MVTYLDNRDLYVSTHSYDIIIVPKDWNTVGAL